MRRWSATRVFTVCLISLGVLGAWGCSTGPAVEQATAAYADRTGGIDSPTVTSVAMTVSDMDSVLAFYRDVLTFEIESDLTTHSEQVARLVAVEGATCRVVTLVLGSERLQLVDFLQPEGRRVPADSQSNDRWFQHVAIIVSDMDAAIERLTAAGVTFASRGPQRLPDWNTAAAGIRACYFRDPDGRFLEVLSFPPGKGDARWQRKDALFLGIDHTAIVVDNTDASLALYRDVLGLRVVGESENHGVEQERLNNVFSARLRITTLRGSAGPAVELLEYLSPCTGRPTPADFRTNDLAHWHICLDTPALDALETRTRQAASNWVSPGIVSGVADVCGANRALLCRDDDGHALLLMEQARLRSSAR